MDIKQHIEKNKKFNSRGFSIIEVLFALSFFALSINTRNGVSLGRGST